MYNIWLISSPFEGRGIKKHFFYLCISFHIKMNHTASCIFIYILPKKLDLGRSVTSLFTTCLSWPYFLVDYVCFLMVTLASLATTIIPHSSSKRFWVLSNVWLWVSDLFQSAVAWSISRTVMLGSSLTNAFLELPSAMPFFWFYRGLMVSPMFSAHSCLMTFEHMIYSTWLFFMQAMIWASL